MKIFHEQTKPQLLFRNLNEITYESEKLEGRSIWEWRLLLKKFICEANSINLGFVGTNFTRDNDIGGTLF